MSEARQLLERLESRDLWKFVNQVKPSGMCLAVRHGNGASPVLTGGDNTHHSHLLYYIHPAQHDDIPPQDVIKREVIGRIDRGETHAV